MRWAKTPPPAPFPCWACALDPGGKSSFFQSECQNPRDAAGAGDGGRFSPSVIRSIPNRFTLGRSNDRNQAVKAFEVLAIWLPRHEASHDSRGLPSILLGPCGYQTHCGPGRLRDPDQYATRSSDFFSPISADRLRHQEVANTSPNALRRTP
jgi:transposase InsO family protein